MYVQGSGGASGIRFLDSADNVDGNVYAKGAVVMDLLRDVLGDEPFQKGLQHYTKENEVLKEFSRILKPGGQLYICSDGSGLPFYKIITLGIKKLKLR